MSERNGFVGQAFAHPLRVRILVVLAGHPNGGASPRMLATQFDEPLGNVSYHVRTLVGLGLLKLDRTEPRRGAIEHYYRLVASPEAILTRALEAARA